MNRIQSSRRAFFLQGGAVLGAGAATAVGAAGLADATPAQRSSMPAEDQLGRLRQQLAGVEDREAIRQLHLAFTSLVEQRSHEAAAELFETQAQLNLSGVSATGRPAILKLFVDQHRNQGAAAIHSAYRQNTLQQKDAVTLSDDGRQAAATFHVEVELCTPLQGDCTAAQMARLLGHVADRRWEAGRFEARYVKTRGEWKISSLSYVAA